MLEDFEQDEVRALIRAALEALPEVEKVAPGPRHNEFRIDFKDRPFRVVSLQVRDFI